MTAYARRGKRALDVSFVVLSAPFVLPLAATLAILVRLKLGAPVLFRQARAGQGGRTFFLIKFRSMTDERGDDGQLLADGDRLTRFGAVLRRLSLDEIPTLWNVLRGDMSLVGPRPLHVRYLPRYSAEQARRHEVLPGVTGLAQVAGRNALTWDQKFALDIEYLRRVSLMTDLRIIFRTAAVVCRRQGITQPGHATAEEFKG